MPPRTVIAAFAALVLLGAASCPRQRDSSPQLIILSWDGAGDWIVDRLMAEGRLPHLARLASRGVAAEHSLSSVPTKTAVAYATLWTGCWPDCHGVTGNWVIPRPDAEHSLLESARGYSSEVLRAEPLYVTAAKAGKKVAVLSATQSYPEWPHAENLRRAGVPEGRYLSFSGFEHRVANATVLDASRLRPARGGWDGVQREGRAFELDFQVADSSFRALAYDSSDDPTVGLDRVLVHQVETGARATLTPRPAGAFPGGWSAPFRVAKGELAGNTFFRLFELAPDGSLLTLYQREASALKGEHSPDRLGEYLDAYPGFHDTGAARYREGALGTPLMLGGDGTAEDRMLEISAFDAELLARGTLFALEAWRPDVLLHYSPWSDDAGHLWIGLLDPRRPGHDPELAAKIWPRFARAYEQLDAWLGTVMDAAPDAVIALVSDHGMAGSTRYVYLNHALEQAGLLARDDAGEVDLTRTRVMAADSDFFLRVNERSWKGGIVDDAERDAVLAAAAEALTGIRDPERGTPVITRVIHPRDFPLHGISSERSGDLYFDLAPGFYPQNGVSDRLFGPPRWPWPEGSHGYWHERRDMHAIFYAAGPGLKGGITVPPIRHIDVAPTLARLAGFPAPPQARGEVVEAMLAP